MDLKIALKVNALDNVATVFTNDVKKDDLVDILDKKGNHEVIQIINDIPFGHKVAIGHVSKGEHIIKYGEKIGVATKEIEKGEYVHVHNLDSQRGRGDS